MHICVWNCANYCNYKIPDHPSRIAFITLDADNTHVDKSQSYKPQASLSESTTINKLTVADMSGSECLLTCEYDPCLKKSHKNI